MSKKKEITESEETIFRDAMKGVQRLVVPNKIAPIKPIPKLKKHHQHTDEYTYAPLSDVETLEPLTSEMLVEYKQSGIQHKILRKLRAGQYNVEAILDLHGMTVSEAKESLYRFLMRCFKNGVRHALIIHGKGRISGKPVLKNKLNHWLRQIENVLAFCSATAREGRSGAMYVLLKNQKGEM